MGSGVTLPTLREIHAAVNGAARSGGLVASVASGVVHRESYHEVPPRVEYSMTAAGRDLLEALEPLGNWASRHIGLITASKPD